MVRYMAGRSDIGGTERESAEGLAGSRPCRRRGWIEIMLRYADRLDADVEDPAGQSGTRRSPRSALNRWCRDICSWSGLADTSLCVCRMYQESAWSRCIRFHAKMATMIHQVYSMGGHSSHKRPSVAVRLGALASFSTSFSSVPETRGAATNRMRTFYSRREGIYQPQWRQE